MRENIEEIEVPAAFGVAFEGGYLGDPDVVNGLVAQFASEYMAIGEKLAAQSLSPDEFVSAARALVKEHGDIFSGRNLAYPYPKGYNDFSLPLKLKPYLGEFWVRNRQSWNDDPVYCLFEYLAVMITQKLKVADGDEFLFEVAIKPTYQTVVAILLGVEKRVTGDES